MESIPLELVSYLEQGVIDQWIGEISGGKEATVHLAGKGEELLAVKIFRPRDERSFRNRADYGMAMMPPQTRETRAMRNRSRFGKAVEESLWCQRETETLRMLTAAGADVPRLVAHGGSLIVMEYFGTLDAGALRLADIRQRLPDAAECLSAVLRNLGLFLEAGIVHGDLSPYNILYHCGRIVIIDFPQAVLLSANTYARTLFERDVLNVCGYFRRQGLASDAGRIAHTIWSEHAIDHRRSYRP